MRRSYSSDCFALDMMWLGSSAHSAFPSTDEDQSRCALRIPSSRVIIARTRIRMEVYLPIELPGSGLEALRQGMEILSGSRVEETGTGTAFPLFSR